MNSIKSGFSDLINEIKNTSEDGFNIKKPNEIVDIVENIFEFNRQT